MYKLAALDIDGTILHNKILIMPQVYTAINRLSRRGIPVCLCSGRNLYNMLPIAKKFGLDTHLVTIDGTTVYSIKERKTVYSRCLKRDTIGRILSSIDLNAYVATAVTDNELLHYSKSHELCDKTVINTNNPFKRFFYERYWGIKKTADYEYFLSQLDNIRELTLMHYDSKALKWLSQELGAHDFGEPIRLVAPWPGMMFVDAPEVSKAHGVEKLCEIYNIGMDEVVAIGNDLNDIEMVSSAGMGVAMGNSVPELKAVAKHITGHILLGGAASALNKYFL